MNTTPTAQAAPTACAPSLSTQATRPALKFITCGSVDDGKSTLIGRLLVDSKSVLQDQLASVSRGGTTDLALLTDGLSAEREQGITIDVAYRYFATAQRKFIIGDTPGHEQYTRNMVTAASSADAAVVLVDATKLQWQSAELTLLPQTRRHALLCHMLRVPSVVFAVNKLDAVGDAALAFANIAAALNHFATQAGMAVAGIVPISALLGHNVLAVNDPWAAEIGAKNAQFGSLSSTGGKSLLQILEQLPVRSSQPNLGFAMPVQWVEKSGSGDATTAVGRRLFWGRVGAGTVRLGDVITLPNGQSATVARLTNTVREPVQEVTAGNSAGIGLERELDVSRGDWLCASTAPESASPSAEPSEPVRQARSLRATVAWLDDEPLQAGRSYWALHGHQWLKARLVRVLGKTDIQTLASTPADSLSANDLGEIELQLQSPVATLPYAQSQSLGSMVLVDTASHKTAAAVMVTQALA